MKNSDLIIIFLLFTLNIFGESKIDSLNNILTANKINSTEKINILNELGKLYLKQNPDSSYLIADKIYGIAIIKNDSLNIGNSYKLKGDASIYSGRIKISEQKYKLAITIYEKINRNDLVFDVKNNLGIVYQLSGQYEKAINLYKESLKFSINKKDTLSIAISYNNIGSVYIKMGENNKALKFLKKSIKYKQDLNDSIGIAKALQNIGNILLDENKYTQAIDYYTNALTIKFKLQDSLTASTTLSNIGLAYKKSANFENAIKFYYQALEIAKKYDYKKQMALIYNNIASTYDYWSDLDETNTYYKEKSTENYSKALSISEEIKDYEGIINTCNNLGILYTQRKDYDKSLAYLLKCLKYTEKYNYEQKEIFVYINIADLYYKKHELTDALYYINKSLSVLEKHPDNDSYVQIYTKLAKIYLEKNNIGKSKKYAEKALDYNKNGNNQLNNKDIYDLLYKIHYKLNNYKQAIDYQTKFFNIKDSIFNSNTKNTILNLQIAYKTKEQKQEIKLLDAKNKLNTFELKSEKLKLYHQKIISIGLISVIILVLFFIYILYKQIKAKVKANKLLNNKNLEITKQKGEIEEQLQIIKKQNTEITDSINYARLIQDALLPPLNILDSSFNDYFILYKPKSIVSGDFYWTSQIGNKIIIAVADCTGHGVPGAFMSMLGISFLNDITSQNKDLKSGKILDLLRKKVIFSLKQESIENNQNDGMDISISIIDTKNKIIDYAGAYNPLIILTPDNSNTINQFKNNTSILKLNNFSLVEIKGDRMPISISRKTESFNSNKFSYTDNDRIFMFSDGFVDQFSYKTHKKYKKSKFKKLLLDTSNNTINYQSDILKKSYNDWKGSIEQTDDVLIIGINL